MTDDELIDRLRDSLRTHAVKVTAPPDAWDQFQDRAGQTLGPATDQVRRPLWLPGSLVAVAAIAAAIALFMVLRSPGGHTAVKLSNPPATTPAPSISAVTTPPTSPPATLGAPTTVPAPAVTPAPAGPRGGPVPKGFTPVSVTFVSLQAGWVLGTAPCATPPCTSLLRTTDGGRTWVGIPAPVAPLSQYGGSGVRLVRFADPLDGWVFGTQLWATHDGGSHWNQVVLPGTAANAEVMDLEAAAGLVHAAMQGAAGPILIETSSVSQDNWVASPTTVTMGAGPIPSVQIILQGRTGWLLEDDRTVVGGARLNQGRWAPWQPPCQTLGGPASLTAANASTLVAVCVSGIWTGPGPPTTRTFVSSDGGVTFHATPTLPPISEAGSVPVASGSPGTIVIGAQTFSSQKSIPGLILVASFNGGTQWATVARYQVMGAWSDLGFTSPTQGVAVVMPSAPGQLGTLLMTTDGGHTWKPVAF